MLSHNKILGACLVVAVLAAASCKNYDTTIRKVDYVEPTPTADYELVSPIPREHGVYKINDLESGTVIYVTVWNGDITSAAVQVAYIPDGTPP